MKLNILFAVVHALGFTVADTANRQLLSYAPVPAGTYTAAKSGTTLLDLVKSRSDLSILASVLEEAGGFTEAFDTSASWKFTFFAPSDTAFNNTGAYFSTYASTPKGKWWLGNLIQHHYIPNSELVLSNFNSTLQRFQTGTFLFISAQVVDGQLILNNASAVTEGDLTVTNGVVHIIDHVLDPSAQIFQSDLPKVSQAFIAGSCSNPALPYC